MQRETEKGYIRAEQPNIPEDQLNLILDFLEKVGLTANPKLKHREVYISSYENKIDGKSVGYTYKPTVMVAGAMKIMRECGMKQFSFQEVKANDFFEFVTPEYGKPNFRHNGKIEGGIPVGYYYVMYMNDGSCFSEFRDLSYFDKCRAASKKSTAWTNFSEEMKKKSLIHLASKSIPHSEKLNAMLDNDFSEVSFENLEIDNIFVELNAATTSEEIEAAIAKIENPKKYAAEITAARKRVSDMEEFMRELYAATDKLQFTFLKQKAIKNGFFLRVKEAMNARFYEIFPSEGDK